MKTFTPSKLFLFMILLAFYSSGNAQIIIADTDFSTKLDLGDTVVTYLDTVTPQINVGAAGQNNWDLTALVVNEEFVSESKVHSTSPYSSNFPSAEYASNYAGIFAGTYSNSWVYNSVSDGLITHGTGSVANSPAGDVKVIISYNPAWTQYKLPLTYGDTSRYSGTQTIKTTVSVPVFGDVTNTITQDVIVRLKVDGYGLVTMPDGKKVNALRMIEETTFNLDGNITTSTVIKLLAKTGESVAITPVNQNETSGLIDIDGVSWTSGSGESVLADRPEPPSELVATAKTDKIDLMWTDNSDNETGFYIERSEDGGGFVRIDSTGTDVTNFSDMNVTPGMVYVYRVFAYNNDGISTSTLVASAFISVTVNGPSTLTVNISQTSIGITWIDASNNETGFYVERSGSGTKSANDEFVVIDSVSANITSFVDVNVEPGVEYTYRVRAYNEFALSEYSNTILAKIEITLAAPNTLTATVNGENIDLIWTDNSDNEAGFYVERSEDGGSFVLIDSTSANVSVFSNSDVSAGVQYSYRVSAYYNEIKSEYTNAASARIIPTGNDFIPENNDYSLGQNYPNPFRSNTTISFQLPRKEHVVLTVYGIDGRVIQQLINADMEKGEHAIDFTADGLKGGIYHYQLKTDYFIATKRMRLIK